MQICLNTLAEVVHSCFSLEKFQTSVVLTFSTYIIAHFSNWKPYFISSVFECEMIWCLRRKHASFHENQICLVLTRYWKLLILLLNIYTGESWFLFCKLFHWQKWQDPKIDLANGNHCSKKHNQTLCSCEWV